MEEIWFLGCRRFLFDGGDIVFDLREVFVIWKKYSFRIEGGFVLLEGGDLVFELYEVFV